MPEAYTTVIRSPAPSSAGIGPLGCVPATGTSGGKPGRAGASPLRSAARDARRNAALRAGRGTRQNTEPDSDSVVDAPASHPLAPKQERSRQTAERITAAALALLERKSFGELSVAEIARHAGVSVGGFYARFPSKQALLQYFDATIVEGILSRASRELDSERLAGASARTVVRTYVGLAVTAFRRHKNVLQQVALRSRTSQDQAFRQRIRQANAFLHGRFRALLEERKAEIGHPDPRLAIDLGLTFVSATMREYVLFAQFRPDFAPVKDGRLVRELTDAFCAYLRIQGDER